MALAISATTLAEIEGTPDRDKHQTLLDIATAFPIAKDVTLGHSVLGMDFLSNEEDDARLRQVFSTLWPDRDFDADARGDTQGKGTTCFRDAKQVSDAFRNRFHTFVTCDRQLLRGDTDDLGVRIICTRTATRESLEAINGP